MSERERYPKEEPTDFGPLNQGELDVLLRMDKEGRLDGYLQLVDRYHDIFQLVRSCGIDGSDAKVLQSMDKERDRLHKQIERVGTTFGKSKADVLADLIGREGNLGDYGLPEFAVISFQQLQDSDTFSVSGLDHNETKRENFARTAESAVQLHRNHRQFLKINKMRDEGEPSSGEVSDTNSFLREVKGFGMVDVVSQIRPNELVIIFTSSFTIDIHQEPASIFPPGFYEKSRRACRAIKALALEGVQAKLFEHTTGAYHRTTSILGIVVPTDKIDPIVAGVLRSDKSSFGIRPEDLDRDLIKQEYLEDIQKNPFTPESMFFEEKILSQLLPEVVNHLFSDKSDEEKSQLLTHYFKSVEAAVYNSHGVDASKKADLIQILHSTFPSIKPEDFERLIQIGFEYLNKDLELAQGEFLEFHKSFFGSHS